MARLLRTVRWMLLALCTSALLACERQPAAAEAPTAEAGGPRLVVLSPALGRIVRDLGLADAVVGRHAWDRGFPGVPSVGDQAAIDYERLRRVRPTHVLLQWGDRALPPRFVELAEDEGWQVENIEILTFGEIAAATRRVAAAIGDDGAQERAEELVAALEHAARERPGLGERAGRVVSIYGIDPLGVAGPGSFTHELVERVGADAVPDEGAAFIAMDPEDLRRMDPDTVVVWAPGIEPAEERSIVDRLERLELRAVREGRVVFVRSEGALLPSTGMIEVGEELGRALRDFARPSPRGHLWELRLKTAASVSVLESPKI